MKTVSKQSRSSHWMISVASRCVDGDEGADLAVRGGGAVRGTNTGGRVAVMGMAGLAGGVGGRYLGVLLGRQPVVECWDIGGHSTSSAKHLTRRSTSACVNPRERLLGRGEEELCVLEYMDCSRL